MEAAFMVHPELLVTRIIFILLFFTGCDQPVKETVRRIQVNENDTALHAVNGIVYYHNQLLTGTVFSLFGNSRDTASLSSYTNGKEDGVWKKWYAPGKVKEGRAFANGKKTGVYIAYWENGNRQLQYFYDNDEYEGTCREWNSNAVLIKEMNYKKGHEEGEQKLFYDNGKTRSNYVIINGRRFGLLGTKNCVNVSDSIFKK